MIDFRFVCLYPQRTYCGKEICPLSKYCRQFPKATKRLLYQDLRLNKKNKVSKTEQEKKEHARLYRFYNCLFGDLREKNILRSRNYYNKNREGILSARRKPVSYKLPIVYSCEYVCEQCPYPDCTLKLYESRKEYMDMYTEKFHHKLLMKKAEYRKNNRDYLKNTEKLRNYKKKGYRLVNVYLVKASVLESEYSELIGSKGIICFLKINSNPYFVYITENMQHSFRRKIKQIREEKNAFFIEVENDVFFEALKR